MVANGELGEIKRVNWIITTWFRTDGYYVRLFQPHLLHPTPPPTPSPPTPQAVACGQNRGGWRGTWAGEGGGVLTNQCPHNLDLLQCAPQPPTTATHSLSSLLDCSKHLLSAEGSRSDRSCVSSGGCWA